MIHFESIEKYYLEFLSSKAEYKNTLPSNKRFKRIEGHLRNKKKIVTQITFLTECAPMFNEFLLKFQAEGPMIHILHSELKSVLLQVLRRIVKAGAVN